MTGFSAGKKQTKVKKIREGVRHAIFFDDGVDELPAAGYQRDEILKTRQAALDEQSEKYAQQMTVGVGDLRDKVRPEREILRYYDSVAVSNKVDGYSYAWVCEDHPMNAKGIKITEKMMRPGWEIVCGDMPEAAERKEVRGYRKIGDTVLMRCKADVERQNRLRDRELEAKLEASVDGNLQEIGDRAAARGFAHVHTDINDPFLQRHLKRDLGRQLATREFDGMVREGRIPGIEVGT